MDNALYNLGRRLRRSGGRGSLDHGGGHDGALRLHGTDQAAHEILQGGKDGLRHLISILTGESSTERALHQLAKHIGR